MKAAHVELSTRALKDLRGLDASTRSRVENFIQQRLRAMPLPANVDLRPLERKAPWLRARVGDVRIICRRLSRIEIKAHEIDAEHGYLVVRIVHRRNLGRAVGQL